MRSRLRSPWARAAPRISFLVAKDEDAPAASRLDLTTGRTLGDCIRGAPDSPGRQGTAPLVRVTSAGSIWAAIRRRNRTTPGIFSRSDALFRAPREMRTDSSNI